MKDDVLTIPQAIKIVEDLLFNTSNKLYNLNLPLEPLTSQFSSRGASDLDFLTKFLKDNPRTKFLRLQYLDYTATPRVRVIPIKRALRMLGDNQKGLSIGITKASLGLLQNDTTIPGVTATGQYNLHAIFSSLKLGPTKDYASVQGELREEDGSEANLCPRSILRRIVQQSNDRGLEFLLGFEIEVVLLSRSSGPREEKSTYTPILKSGGHAWSSSRALQNSTILKVVDEIYDALFEAGIYLEQWHAESSSGQYEFVLPTLPLSKQLIHCCTLEK